MYEPPRDTSFPAPSPSPPPTSIPDERARGRFLRLPSSAAMNAKPTALTRARVLFLHQAVGENVVDGLARRGVVTAAPLAHRPMVLAPGAVSHIEFAHQRNPMAKIAQFERLFGRGAFVDVPDVVVMKLSADDFDAGSDVDLVVERYATAVAALRAQNPSLQLVHATTPLVRGAHPLLDLLHRRTGLRDDAARANIARARYNAALRQRFALDVLFDLERLCATNLDGRPSTMQRSGRRWPTLGRSLTNDGRHLNRVGSDLAAIALVDALQLALMSKPAR